MHWSRQELNVADDIVLAAMVDRLTGPGSQEDLERLVDHRPPYSIVDLVSCLRELAGELVSADTYPENEAATA